MIWIRSFLIIMTIFFTQVTPGITSPRSGEILRGLVVVYGKTDTIGFVSSDLEYTYTNYAPNTWFLISQANQPVHDGILAAWDTTEISDGEYILRLSVHLSDGSTTETMVSGLHVRNYTPTETLTPPDFPENILPTKMTMSPLFPLFAESVQRSNSVGLNQLHIHSSFKYGALVAFALLLFIYIYTRLRRN